MPLNVFYFGVSETGVPIFVFTSEAFAFKSLLHQLHNVAEGVICISDKRLDLLKGGNILCL